MDNKDFLTVATDETTKNVSTAASLTGLFDNRLGAAKQTIKELLSHNIRKTIYRRPLKRRFTSRFAY